MLTVMMTTTGYLFWTAIGLIILLDMLAVSTEDDGFGAWAVFLTVTGFLLSVLFTDAFIGINWAWLVVGLAAYLLLGICWSFKKWIDFVKWSKKNGRREMPVAKDNKQKLTTWMATWPISFAWWVLTYPRHFFIWAYERLSTVYDRIAAKIWESK